MEIKAVYLHTLVLYGTNTYYSNIQTKKKKKNQKIKKKKKKKILKT